MTTRFGDLVANLRKQQGMSQAALAKAVGLERTSIANLESGETAEPSLMTALRLCNVLEITPNEMAAHFGMWHGKSQENDRLGRQLAQTLANLEEIATHLDDSGQMALDDMLHMIVRNYQPFRQRRTH